METWCSQILFFRTCTEINPCSYQTITWVPFLTLQCKLTSQTTLPLLRASCWKFYSESVSQHSGEEGKYSRCLHFTAEEQKQQRLNSTRGNWSLCVVQMFLEKHLSKIQIPTSCLLPVLEMTLDTSIPPLACRKKFLHPSNAKVTFDLLLTRCLLLDLSVFY